MGFLGALPQEVLAQVARVLPLKPADRVYVCCSGSFRFEQLLRQLEVTEVVSNDVSLLSCAIGHLATTGEALQMRFVGALEFLEGLATAPEERVGALLVGLEMGAHSPKHEHGRAHLMHYRVNIDTYLASAAKRITAIVDAAKVDRFEGRDFRQHAREGAAKGAVILGYPPTKARAYERHYGYLHANVEWQQPDYQVFDPDTLEQWLAELDETGCRYCIVSDRELPTRLPAARHRTSRQRGLCLYASGSTCSSVSQPTDRLAPFAYEPATELRPHAEVSVRQVDLRAMAFLRTHYMARGIKLSMQTHLNFLVYVDERLLGGFSYQKPLRYPGIKRPQSTTRYIYLLSDVSVTRLKYAAKLVAMLATSRTLVAVAEEATLARYQQVVTTAFTDNPISMKYRGIFELLHRGEGYLQYGAAVRDASPQEIYDEWYRRYGHKNRRRARGAHRGARAEKPKAHAKG